MADCIDIYIYMVDHFPMSYMNIYTRKPFIRPLLTIAA